MQNDLLSTRRVSLAASVVVFGLTFVLVYLPGFLGVSSGAPKGLFTRTESHTPGLDNYDIRTDKSAVEKIDGFRDRNGRSAVNVADLRDSFIRGENDLRRRVPTLKVEYNNDIRTPEVIAPDIRQGRNTLTPPSGARRAEILRQFAKDNASLIGLAHAQADQLQVAADYSNPDGNLSFAELEQTINGIPVFRGQIRAGFTRRGEIVRVINDLAPGLNYQSLSADFGDPVAAVRSAARNIGADQRLLDLSVDNAVSDEQKIAFGSNDLTAEKMYFPTEPGVAVPAWRVMITQPQNAYYVIVDAQTGTVLWRKDLTEDQTQAATYYVFANPNAMVNVADSPFPFSPGPITPGTGSQGMSITRTIVTRIGNEPPYTFNNLGWIPDGGNETNGNNVEAGLDRDTTDGVDTINGRAVGSPGRTFNFSFAPGDPNTNTGDSPVPPGEPITSGCAAIIQPHGMVDAQRGAVTQLFYIVNWFHDETYRLGFTEQARNFQNDNFGRGGVGNDPVSAQAQDCSGTNNANFNTPADGSRGRMQMYIWSGPTPPFDGDLDAEIVMHEATHGLSNRLHGNASGLSTNMSRGMGEGWSDFYAQSLLSEPTDPINGIYAMGGYATYRATPTYTGNYYYGIRRFPKAVMSFTGGPNNRPHNPLTFADIDATQFNIGDGAFPPGPFGQSSSPDQVHNAGEVWSSALWEVRARMIQRLGWEVGNRKVLQLVTDGMKLAPLGPTFLQERDAIIAAAQASSLAPEAAADVADVWAGFAVRGMGFSASVVNIGTGTGNTRVTEAFDLPNLVNNGQIMINDSNGNNNGFPEPGEPITLTIGLANNTGTTASNTTLQIVGGSPVDYGTINNGMLVARPVPFTVPSGSACGSVLNLTINVNSSLGPTSFVRTIILGVPVQTFAEDFDGVTAPGFPAGWSVTSRYAPMTFVTRTLSPQSVPNSAFAADLPSGTGGPATDGGDTDLTSPSLPISASAAVVTFAHKYNSEPGWDGGVLEISIGGGPFTDIIAAGGRFISNGYNGFLGVSQPNPLGGRTGWTGDSGGYITSSVQLPASAAGQNVQLRWRFGADNNTAPAGGGWDVDSIRVVGSYTCSTVDIFARPPFDFDGDRKSDISVFRPGPAEWWIQRSSGTTVAAQFGSSTDEIVPGDFTGDGKTDIAFFRPSTGEWFVLRSEDGSFYSFPFGTSGDIPLVGDYDGDGKADATIYRPSGNIWFIQRSSGGTDILSFGAAGDLPITGDWDGDGKADVAIFRPSGSSGGAEWWVQRSTAGLLALQFGSSTDKAVAADFTGDGKTDCAFYRPGSSATWFVLRSEDFSYYAFPFGTSGDLPIQGDYDGDGKADAGVFRPSTSTWFVQRSTAGTMIVPFGTTGDIPVPGAFIP
jgi:hypothetical protein